MHGITTDKPKYKIKAKIETKKINLLSDLYRIPFIE
jgi:hypothetical protein